MVEAMPHWLRKVFYNTPMGDFDLWLNVTLINGDTDNPIRFVPPDCIGYKSTQPSS